MKKLTAGIFTVLIGLCAANSADAAIASKAWVEQYAVSGDIYTTDKSGLESSIATAKQAGDDAAAALETYKGTNDAAVLANTNAISAINSETDGILKKAKDYTDALANGQVTTNKEDIATINEKLKSVASTEGLATLTSTVEGHTTAINTLNGDANTAGSVSKSIADAVTALKNGEIKDNADAIDALEGLVGSTSVEAQVVAGINSLDVTDAAVEKQFVTSVSEADGKITVSRAALVATDIPTIEQSQVNGLTDALNAKLSSTDAANTYQTIDAMVKKDETVASDAQDSVYPTLARTQDMIGNSITNQIVNGYVGAIGDLQVEGAETIVGAINQVNAEADQNASDIEANATAIDNEVKRAKAAEEANATAAANAQSAADAAQETANAAIPKPTVECTNKSAKCVLTVGESGYAWEVVERAGNE